MLYWFGIVNVMLELEAFALWCLLVVVFDFLKKHLPHISFLPPTPYHSQPPFYPHLHSNKYNHQCAEGVDEILTLGELTCA